MHAQIWIKILFSTRSNKISAVSTPNFALISPFFCIFRDLPEYTSENACYAMRCDVMRCDAMRCVLSTREPAALFLFPLPSVFWCLFRYISFTFYFDTLIISTMFVLNFSSQKKGYVFFNDLWVDAEVFFQCLSRFLNDHLVRNTCSLSRLSWSESRRRGWSCSWRRTTCRRAVGRYAR